MPETTSLRLGDDIIQEAEALIPLLRDVPELRIHGKVNRSTVLRLAILLGLEAIRDRYDPDK